jgi:ribonuclease P/MRP protein subunit POP1
MSSAAGPSGASADSASAACTKISVADFFSARAKEVTEFRAAVGSTQGAKRIFQLLPKHLRRRAMSHNHHLLPRRLRRAGEREMKLSGHEAPKKPPRRLRRKPKNLLNEYTRRNQKYKWLETHIWLAKRMRMRRMWGWKVPEKASERGVRAGYHASRYGSSLFDASMHGCIELSAADRSLIVSLVSSFLAPHSAAAISAADASRYVDVLIYQPDRYPFGFLCPGMFLWSSDGLQAWLFVHAAAFNAIFDALTQLSSENNIVSVHNLQFALNRFEIRGARANTLLHAALSVDESNTSKRCFKVWSLLKYLQSTDTMPRNVVLSLDVHDPRSCFPPVPPHFRDEPSQSELDAAVVPLHSLMVQWPDRLHRSPLWNAAARSAESAKMVAEHQINAARRSRMLRGLPPKLDPKVDEVSKVSVLLMQRENGWDLIVPSGWGAVFWRTLVFAGGRAIALCDRERKCAEKGAVCFPRDSPDTLPHVFAASERALERAAEYHKRPPAKRVNYTRYDMDSPFLPWWHYCVTSEDAVWPFPLAEDIDLLDRSVWLHECRVWHVCEDAQRVFMSRKRIREEMEERMSEAASVDTQSLLVTLYDLPRPDAYLSWTPSYYLVRDAVVLHRLSREGGLLELAKQDGVIPEQDRAMVSVVLTMANRGRPTEGACIYLPTLEDLKQYHGGTLSVPEAKNGVDHDDSLSEEDEDLCWDSVRFSKSEERAMIGYCTANGFSFVRGCGFAVGAVGLTMWMQHARYLAEHGHRDDASLVLVRNTESMVARFAHCDAIQASERL